MKPDGTTAGFPESFHYALEGLADAWRGRNFRIMSAVGALAVVFGLLFRISAIQWVVVVFCIGAVLAAEAANTALEELVDLSVKSYQPQAKRAKDVAASAVLILSAASFLIGCIIYLPRLIEAVQRLGS